MDISNQLAELFPTLTRHYDEHGNAIVQLNDDAETITSTLNELLKTERALANQKIVENIPDLYSGIKRESDNYNQEIESLIEKNKKYRALVEDTKSYKTDLNNNMIVSYQTATMY